MKKRTIWIIISSVVVLIVLLVILKKTGVIGKEEGTEVTAEAAGLTTITETVTASGKVFPEVEVKVSSDISGEVVQLYVNEGDTVRKGQVLARIYADIYATQQDQAAAIVSQSEAQVANAAAQLGALKATLDQAKANYDRQKKLREQEVISKAEFEQAQQSYQTAQANYNAAEQSIKANQASVRSARANLSRASKDVGRANIIAPMDGVISLLAIKKGERVVGTAQMAGTEMMRIADLGTIEVQVEVGENDIPKVSLGDTAIITVDAYNNRKFKGLVYKIANPTLQSSIAATTTVTNYKVHIRLLQSSYADLMGAGKPFPFRPNMSATADIQTMTKKDVIAVPINSVTTRDKKGEKRKKQNEEESTGMEEESLANADDIDEVVFVVDSSKQARKRVVKTGIQDINKIEIVSGLKSGEMVITGPYNVVSKDLKDSTKVKIVEKDKLMKKD